MKKTQLKIACEIIVMTKRNCCYYPKIDENLKSNRICLKFYSDPLLTAHRKFYSTQFEKKKLFKLFSFSMHFAIKEWA